MRTHLRTLAITLVTVALLAWFLRQADFTQVWREIQSARPGALALMVAVTALTYVIRAHRWQVLLRPVGRVRFREAFRTTVIGFAANTVLPARIGEIVRPYLLARREGLSITATFATIILERLLDALTVLLLFGLFVQFFDPGLGRVDAALYEKVKVGAGLGAAAAVAGLVMVMVLAARPHTVRSAVEGAARLFPPRLAARLGHLAATFVLGLAVVRQPRQLGLALAWSLPLWLSIALGIWLITFAFHMTIPYTGTFLVVALLVVGVAVPTPGAVGGFHEAFRIGATVFYGVANDRAVGAAIVLHALSFLPVTVLGVAFMLQDGLSLRGVRQLGEAAREAEAGEEAALPPLGAGAKGEQQG